MTAYQWIRRERMRFGKRQPHPYSAKGRGGKSLPEMRRKIGKPNRPKRWH